MKRIPLRRGGVLVVALVTLLVVTLITGTVVRSILASHRQSRLNHYELQAQWLAESAVFRAAAQIKLKSDYTGETWQPPIPSAEGVNTTGIAEIRVENSESQSGRVRVVVTSRYPADELRQVSVSREYMLNQPPLAPREGSENAP
jgi:hypothetical protein